MCIPVRATTNDYFYHRFICWFLFKTMGLFICSINCPRKPNWRLQIATLVQPIVIIPKGPSSTARSDKGKQKKQKKNRHLWGWNQQMGNNFARNSTNGLIPAAPSQFNPQFYWCFMGSVYTHESAVPEFWLQHIFQWKCHDVVEVLHLKQARAKQIKVKPITLQMALISCSESKLFTCTHCLTHSSLPTDLHFWESVWSIKKQLLGHFLRVIHWKRTPGSNLYH